MSAIFFHTRAFCAFPEIGDRESVVTGALEFAFDKAGDSESSSVLRLLAGSASFFDVDTPMPPAFCS